MFDLRSFLRRKPQPRMLRIETPDGTEKTIDLGEGRTRWHQAEETVRAANAAKVECLDKDGKVLRAQRLSDDDVEARDSDDAQERSADKLLTRQHAMMAAMFDSYGKRIADAYTAGAQAASQSQDQVLSLVETLSSNLSTAIVNLHNVAVTHAQSVQANAEQVAALMQAMQGGEGGSTQALMGLMGKVLGGGQVPDASNGKARR